MSDHIETNSVERGAGQLPLSVFTDQGDEIAAKDGPDFATFGLGDLMRGGYIGAHGRFVAVFFDDYGAQLVMGAVEPGKNAFPLAEIQSDPDLRRDLHQSWNSPDYTGSSSGSGLRPNPLHQRIERMLGLHLR